MENLGTLIGNVGRLSELRFTPAGKAVTDFSLAINNGKDRAATWYKITVWEAQAENAAKYLKKGSKVAVAISHMHPEAWIDKESGEARATINITARYLEYLTAKGEATTADEPQQVDEDDVPF